MRKLLLGLIVLLLPAASLAQDFVRYYPPSGFTVGTGGTLTATGPIVLPAGSVSNLSLRFPTSGVGLFEYGGGYIGVNGGTEPGSLIGSSIILQDFGGFYWSTNPGAIAADLALTRDAANTLALRGVNGANPQAFNIYNTYTDGSNYERGSLYWSGNTFNIDVNKAGTGTSRALRLIFGLRSIQGDASGNFYPETNDVVRLGYPGLSFYEAHFSRSIQGSKSKTIVDNTATAFVRLSVADDDYEGCEVIYTAYAEDTGTDARQTRTGKVAVAILNNGGTEAAAFSTGDSAVAVTAGTFTCTFDGNSASADTIDLRATCDTSLAATTTLTFEWRLDCPSTVTVAPQ